MENKKNNIHLSESLRRKLENFPEEFPSENDWQQVRSRMLSEGLLRKKSNKRRYLILLLLLLISSLTVLVSIPFVNKKEMVVFGNKNIHAQREIKPAEKKEAEGNEVAQDKAREKDEPIKNKDEKFIPEIELNQKPTSAKAVDEKKTSSALPVAPEIKRREKITRAEPGRPDDIAEKAEAMQPDTDVEKEKERNGNNVNSNSAGIMSEIKINIEAETLATKTPSPTAIETNPLNDTTDASSENAAGVPLAVNDSVSAGQPTAQQDSALAAVASETKKEPEDNSGRKIQVGFFISWDRNSYHLEESDNAERTEADYILGSDPVKGDNSSAQYTAGIRASYFIARKTAIEAGAFYSQKRKVDAVIFTPVTSSPSGESVSDYAYHFNARYFEIDGRIKYYVWQNKLSLYVSAGARGSFNLAKNGADYFEHTIYSESAIPRTERVLLKPASPGLSLVAAAGVEFPLNARCNFFFEPSYTHALNPVINNPAYIMVPVNHFRRSISIGTGLNYRF